MKNETEQISTINRNKAFFEQIEKFAPRRKTVYTLIRSYGQLTDCEIADKMCLPINSITGRRRELTELCWIKAIYSKKNEKSNCKNTVWAVTNPVEREDLINEKRQELEEEREALCYDLFSLVTPFGEALLNKRIQTITNLINKL